jgi:hypothetical protein
MSYIEMVKSGYEAFAAGNIPAVLELFSPDIVWHECPGFPWIEGDGVFVGADAIVQNVFAPIPVQYDGFSIEITDLIDGRDKVVMEGYYTGTYKATGKSFRANAAHVWTIRDGKLARFFQCVDVATIVNP